MREDRKMSLPFYFDLKKFERVLGPTKNYTLAIWDTGYRFQGRKWYRALRDIRITIRTRDKLIYVIKKGDAI